MLEGQQSCDAVDVRNIADSNLDSSSLPMLRRSEMQLPQEVNKCHLIRGNSSKFFSEYFKREQEARIVSLSMKTITDYTNLYEEVFWTFGPLAQANLEAMFVKRITKDSTLKEGGSFKASKYVARRAFLYVTLLRVIKKWWHLEQLQAVTCGKPTIVSRTKVCIILWLNTQ